MALSFELKPKQYYQTSSRAEFIPAYSDAMFQVSTNATISSLFKYKFVFDIYINGDKVLRLKTEPNAENKGIIDVSRILQDYVEAEEEAYGQVYSIHKVQQFCASSNSCQIFQIKAGEEYATTSTGAVTLFDGYGNAGNPNKASGAFTFWNGVNQWSDSGTDDEAFRSKFWKSYFLTGTSKKVLSQFAPSSTIKQKIGSNDYHTIAMFYAQFGQDSASYSLVQSASEYGQALITFYDSAGSSTGSPLTFDVKDQIGASGTTLYGTGNSGGDNFIYLGVGTQNMLDNSATIPSDTASYSVVLKANHGAVRSDTYYFEIDDCNPKGFNQVRLAWLNTLGGFDYFTFKRKNITEIINDKTYYGRQHGSWNASSYKQKIHERGKSIVNISATEQMFLNTHLLNETEALFLQDLFSSPVVYMFENSNAIPVCVLDSSYTKRTSANDKIMQYELTIEKAHKIKVQNG